VCEEPRGAAPSGHAVASRVVDDDQVDAAGLLADGRQARGGATADDRLPPRDLRADPFENTCRGIVDAHAVFPEPFSSEGLRPSDSPTPASAKATAGKRVFFYTPSSLSARGRRPGRRS